MPPQTGAERAEITPANGLLTKENDMGDKGRKDKAKKEKRKKALLSAKEKRKAKAKAGHKSSIDSVVALGLKK